ncbi:uncharacterized protein LOC143537295 [Bidens hawaiensis]|uniref:uncharacterized protein LOC143537295 n=1 Tax=Bidens hawaiensis TaxID=980011 RepID=UPI00404B3BE4
MASQQLSDEYAQSLATNFVSGAEINHRMIWYEEAYRRASRRNEKLKSELKTVVGDKLSLLQTLTLLEEDKLQSATPQSRLSKEIEMLRPKVKRLSSDNDALRGLVVQLEKHKAEASSEHGRLSAAVDAANLELDKSKTTANELSVRLKRQEEEISRLYEKEQLLSQENSRLLESLELSKLEVTKLEDERSGLLTRHEEVRVERGRLAHDRHWLISEGFQQVFERVRDSKEWLTLVENISRESVAAGYQNGLIAGYQHAAAGVTVIRNTPHFLPLATVMNNLTKAYNTLQSSGHSLVDQISVSSHQPLDVIRSLIDNREALALPLF